MVEGHNTPTRASKLGMLNFDVTLNIVRNLRNLRCFYIRQLNELEIGINLMHCGFVKHLLSWYP